MIRSCSAADAAQIAAVQRAGWFAAYEGIIPGEIIDQVTAPDEGARVRQTFRTRPWQRMIVAVAGKRETPRPGVPVAPGIVGYASFGPETDVLAGRWPPQLTGAGRDGQVAELYALYIRPAWWSTGTGRALMDQVLARTSAVRYRSVVLWVLRDNTRARRFYERAGFAPDGAAHRLDRLGGVTEVRYQRTLAALRRRRGTRPGLDRAPPAGAGNNDVLMHPGMPAAADALVPTLRPCLPDGTATGAHAGR